MLPLLVRLPPIDRACVVTAPAGLAWKMPPAATVTLLPTVSVRAVAASNCNTPEVPCPTVRLRATAAVSTVTVWPLAMVASSAAVGTKPQLHIPALLQLPLPVEVQRARGALGC